MCGCVLINSGLAEGSFCSLNVNGMILGLWCGNCNVVWVSFRDIGLDFDQLVMNCWK